MNGATRGDLVSLRHGGAETVPVWGTPCGEDGCSPDELPDGSPGLVVETAVPRGTVTWFRLLFCDGRTGWVPWYLTRAVD